MDKQTESREDVRKSTMPHKSKQFFNGSDGIGLNSNALVNIKEASGAVWVDRRKVVSYGLLVFLSLSAGKLNAERIQVNSNQLLSGLTFSYSTTLSIKENLKGIGNSVEFLKLVHSDGPFVPTLNPEFEGNHSPDKRNDTQNESSKGRIAVEQNNKLTPEALHSLHLLPFHMLAAFLLAYPLGVYLSFQGAMRREWRKHTSKGHPLKVPALALLSSVSISRRIKSRRWQIWEQRASFLDMKLRNGLERAYRSSWYWKKLVADKW
jgi:hypothetical protein